MPIMTSTRSLLRALFLAPILLAAPAVWGCGPAGPPQVIYVQAPPPSGQVKPQESEPPPVVKAPPPPKRQVEGADKENPVPRCGPRDSYNYIANLTCQDGSMPLGGKPLAGARARVGNVGANHTGHIIDLYEVPCPEGPLRVYVDMYGCPQDGGGGA